jgi:hypothetical protein
MSSFQDRLRPHIEAAEMKQYGVDNLQDLAKAKRKDKLIGDTIKHGSTIITAILAVGVIALIFMLLWNWVAVAIAAPVLNYWTCVGVVLLLLFLRVILVR